MNLLKLEQLLRIIFAFLSFGGRNIASFFLSLICQGKERGRAPATFNIPKKVVVFLLDDR